MKAAADRRLDAEHPEVVAGHEHRALDTRGRVGLGAEADRQQVGVRDDVVITLRAAADVEVLAIGERVVAVVARRAHDADDVAGARYGIGTQDEAVDHAEARRRHADPQREGDDDERGEAGRAAQAAERVARIVDEVGQPVDSSRVADLFAAQVEAVHRAQRGETGVLRRQSVCDAFFDLVFEMEAQLVVHLALDRGAAEDRPQAQGQRAEQSVRVQVHVRPR